MSSHKNDRLLARTVEGSLNYYDGHKGCATAADKGLAARLGGHSYNIINNSDRDEIYFGNLRHAEHFVDHKKGHHTVHLMGPRRRKFGHDERGLMANTLAHPAEHSRDQAVAQRRAETQLVQMENSHSFGGFQNRMQSSICPPDHPKRFSIHNKSYANEAEKLRPRMTDKNSWMERRGEAMHRSRSAPSVTLVDPHLSLNRAVREDARKEATQRQTESAHAAPWHTANTYSCSMDNTALGRDMHGDHKHCSVHRIENHDFSVTRKNNHYSSEDKITRSDPFFQRPRHSITNNSVKYDIVNNERRWFKY